MSRVALGYIDCPGCGVADSMRVTHDKNGEPFGYCKDGCQLQLRIGGNPHRVKCFTKLHPWAAAPAEAEAPKPAPVTVTAKPAPKAPPKAPQIPVTVTAEKPAEALGRFAEKAPAKPAPARSGLEDVFAFLGGQK